MENKTTALQTIDNSPLAVIPDDVSSGALELAIGRGDLSRLSSEDRLKYIGQICKWVGLNPLTKPIEIINIRGKETLYANKSCAEQLRGRYRISTTITSRSIDNGVCIVTARAKRQDGQEDEAIGAVPINEKGSPEDRANAMMKAETKAKRRVTLSICGLGFMMDETEVETVKKADVTSDVLPSETATDRAELLNSFNEQPQVSKGVVEAEVLPAEPPALVQQPAPAPESTPAPTVTQPTQAPAATAPTQIATGDGKIAPDAAVKVMDTIEAVGEVVALAYLVEKGKIKAGAPINTLDATAANFIIRCPRRFEANVKEWAAARK